MSDSTIDDCGKGGGAEDEDVDVDVLERRGECDKSCVLPALGFVDMLNISCLFNLVNGDQDVILTFAQFIAQLGGMVDECRVDIQSFGCGGCRPTLCVRDIIYI